VSFPDVTLEAALRDVAPRLLRYCVGSMGDRSLGEEVAQDCLTALVRIWRTSGAPRNIDAFVFTVAKRRSRRVRFQRALLSPWTAS
jgi:DNA-directed RNA polymerase specialized sigma24 family protein